MGLSSNRVKQENVIWILQKRGGESTPIWSPEWSKSSTWKQPVTTEKALKEVSQFTWTKSHVAWKLAVMWGGLWKDILHPPPVNLASGSKREEWFGPCPFITTAPQWLKAFTLRKCLDPSQSFVGVTEGYRGMICFYKHWIQLSTPIRGRKLMAKSNVRLANPSLWIQVLQIHIKREGVVRFKEQNNNL